MIQTILKLDVPTASGRIYPTTVVEDALDNTAPSYVIMGTIDSPFSGVPLSQVAAKVESLFIEGGELKADITILNTPYGMILQALVDAQVKLNYSPTMIGSVDVDKTVSSLSFVTLMVEAESDARP